MDQHIINNLEVDEITGNYFKDTAKWARFIAIVYIVCIVLVALVLIVNSKAIFDAVNTYMAKRQVPQNGVLLSTFIAVELAAILVISWFMLRASSFLKNGINNRDQISFNEGLKALKNGL